MTYPTVSEGTSLSKRTLQQKGSQTLQMRARGAAPGDSTASVRFKQAPLCGKKRAEIFRRKHFSATFPQKFRRVKCISQPLILILNILRKKKRETPPPPDFLHEKTSQRMAEQLLRKNRKYSEPSKTYWLRDGLYSAEKVRKKCGKMHLRKNEISAAGLIEELCRGFYGGLFGSVSRRS